MNRLAIRPVAPRGAHRRTPEAWQALMGDLDASDLRVQEQDQELTALRAEVARLTDRQVHADALMGRLVTAADEQAGWARSYYDQLKRNESALRTATEVITNLRQRLSGVIPA